ncbi:restless-like transposase [Pochonia chlamydosporia 170]|uniref:Restless-like transposase n=1 Tax=Pochonia chlamydosporia 170 TaxID=1380566 RepID=A0A219AQE9_METCM|nr:restless-like transposase [Pochonia chlamydosporia 170]OWT43020.1 restless-like transposase [Pochonia chlamydosporia 170]
MPVQSEQQKLLEDRLFRDFKGWTWSERARDTSSWLWDFGCDIQRHGTRKWACKHCILINRPSIASFASSSLQNAANHLWREHKIPAPAREKRSTAQLKSEGAPESKQPTIASALKLNVDKPREQTIANCIISRFDKQHFQRMLVELIVSSNQSFSFVENPVLREIFDYLSPSVSIQCANLSGSAIRYKIIQEYNRHKQRVIEVLRSSTGLLHISFDGWTSRNKLALYGIACFFRDEKDRPCKIIIGVPEAHRHFGSTIGGEVLDVLHALGVSREKIGYFTLDNAENNDTAMEVIGAELGFNGRLRRGRCMGHTINLSAKALLFGRNTDAFEQQLSGAEALSDAEYARWRRKGPVGKLHNIVVDVRVTHRLIYLFKEVQREEIDRATTLKLRSKKPLKLIIDNDTRWLSQLYMIRRALRLKTSIKLLLVRYKAQWEDENRSRKTGQVTQAKLAKKPRILRDENQLTDRDWEVLYHLEAILTVFETVVKTLEGDGHIRKRRQGWTGSYGNVWDVVLGYELLLNTLEEYKELAAGFPDAEYLRIGINLAWDKLDEYYQRLDETPIYYTAMALHPAYRWDWFDETWSHKPSWVKRAKEMVADVWLSDYAHLEVGTTSSRSDEEPPAKRSRFFNPFEKNSRLPSSTPAYVTTIMGDEYQAWQTDREVGDSNVRDPIRYWITKKGRYPRLSRMALDFLTIQPMSAECERLFSAAGKMVSALRTDLDAEIIGICQVLRSWYRAGLIKDLDPLLHSHVETQLDGVYATLSDNELALAESKWLLDGEDSVSEGGDLVLQQTGEELITKYESEAE